MSDTGFSKEEKAAMKARAKELKAAKNKEEAEKAVLDTIAEMGPLDQELATRIHNIVKETAPSLSARTWYGMPAYANEDGKVITFFKAATKFDTRYAELGFNEPANLDDGDMWPTAFALTALTPAVEKKITALVKQAAS